MQLMIIARAVHIDVFNVRFRYREELNKKEFNLICVNAENWVKCNGEGERDLEIALIRQISARFILWIIKIIYFPALPNADELPTAEGKLTLRAHLRPVAQLHNQIHIHSIIFVSLRRQPRARINWARLNQS